MHSHGAEVFPSRLSVLKECKLSPPRCARACKCTCTPLAAFLTNVSQTCGDSELDAPPGRMFLLCRQTLFPSKPNIVTIVTIFHSQHYNTTKLHHSNTTTLQYYKTTILQQYNTHQCSYCQSQVVKIQDRTCLSLPNSSSLQAPPTSSLEAPPTFSLTPYPVLTRPYHKNVSIT